MSTPTDNRDALGPTLDSLYTLLPAIYRAADIGQGYPLLALSGVLDSVREEIGAAIATMEDGWFIETCPEPIVPLIGAMLGAQPAAPALIEHRALVADTLGARRRKGLTAALPRLVRGSSGWTVLYSPATATPPAAWPLTDAVVTKDATAEPNWHVGADEALVPSEATDDDTPSDDTGETGTSPATDLLRVWRRKVYALTGTTPVQIGQTRRYACHPAGLAVSLYNLPNDPLPWTAAPPITALPATLTVAMLQKDLDRYYALWGETDGAPDDSLLYGAARGLAIYLQTDPDSQWHFKPPGSVRAADLTPGSVPPDYAVLRGGTLTLANLTATDVAMTLQLGNASALLNIAVPAAPSSMRVVVDAVTTAIANAEVTASATITAADFQAIVVGSVGTQLALIPTSAPGAPLTAAAVDQGSDPLLLTGSASEGYAAATLPLDATAITALTTATSTAALQFVTPSGQWFNAPLPLAADPATPAGIAAALMVAVPGCFACASGDQVVIVPPPGSAAVDPPPPSTLAYTLGLTPAATIDPQQAMISVPYTWGTAPKIRVDYAIAAPSGIGGLAPQTDASGDIPDDGGDPATLAQIMAMAKAAALALFGGAIRPLASQSVAVASRYVGSAPGRPAIVIDSPSTLTLSGGGDGPTPIALSGMVIVGAIALGGHDLHLSLSDLTLLPPDGTAAIAPVISAPPSTPPSGALKLSIDRTILGPIALTGFDGSVRITDSIVAVLPQPDRTASVLNAPSGFPVTLDRATVVGTALFGDAASIRDSLFDGVVECAGRVSISTSVFADLRMPPEAPPATVGGATLQWCTNCQKPQTIVLAEVVAIAVELDPADLCQCATPSAPEVRRCGSCSGPCANCPLSDQLWRPIYPLSDNPDLGVALAADRKLVVDSAYPAVDFAELHPAVPDSVRAAASNRDVPGSYNHDFPTARALGFRTALREGLLFETQVTVIMES